MNILEINAKKRDNAKLSKEEIDYFIENYTKGEITDYQAAALVMAIYINGMDYEETTNFTLLELGALPRSSYLNTWLPFSIWIW